MQPKISVFIAMSLDGHIARQDGSLDWLVNANHLVSQGEDCGYKSFISSVDMLVMGRHSFEKVLTFDEWPYSNLPVTVMSSNAVEVPEPLKQFVSVSDKAPSDLKQELQAKNIQHVYLDGGITIQRFLQAGLIDEMTITIIPILLGSGRQLFGELKHDMKLEPISTTSYQGGFVQMKYRLK